MDQNVEWNFVEVILPMDFRMTTVSKLPLADYLCYKGS
jgi:hypothetical protein